MQHFLFLSITSRKIETETPTKKEKKNLQVSKIFPQYCADISDRWSSTPVWREERKIEWVAGEKAHPQMARVGVYWQEHQNTSVKSSGTRAARCDWPDCSQELKPGSLLYNSGWRRQGNPITNMASQPTHAESGNLLYFCWSNRNASRKYTSLDA